ncbi:MAG: DUF433 domain-containing protein [Gammaproteobacteria bacterium]|nr:DUF433 domain-containing protein [Gammaproteobacteria bacterium]
MVTVWESCPAVKRRLERVSGAWVFTGTHNPLVPSCENLAGGATVDEFVEWFLGVDPKQVQPVLEFEAQSLRSALGSL